MHVQPAVFVSGASGSWNVHWWGPAGRVERKGTDLAKVLRDTALPLRSYFVLKSLDTRNDAHYTVLHWGGNGVTFRGQAVDATVQGITAVVERQTSDEKGQLNRITWSDAKVPLLGEYTTGGASTFAVRTRAAAPKAVDGDDDEEDDDGGAMPTSITGIFGGDDADGY